jgi:hypothetical protein
MSNTRFTWRHRGSGQRVRCPSGLDCSSRGLVELSGDLLKKKADGVLFLVLGTVCGELPKAVLTCALLPCFDDLETARSSQRYLLRPLKDFLFSGRLSNLISIVDLSFKAVKFQPMITVAGSNLNASSVWQPCIYAFL